MSALALFLSDSVVAELRASLDAAQTPAALVKLHSDVSATWSRGKLTDMQAQNLFEAIDARLRTKPAPQVRTMGSCVRHPSRFAPRRPQRSPDRKASRERRRMFGGSGSLPSNLRQCYTEGQRSVLTIVSGEVKKHGFCDLYIDKIAALAGVCRKSAQNALREAQRLGHVTIAERPRPGSKNLTNIVRIVSKEWLAWLRLGSPSGSGIGCKNGKIIHPTKIKDLDNLQISSLGTEGASRKEGSRDVKRHPERGKVA